jgi:hypothetical protein
MTECFSAGAKDRRADGTAGATLPTGDAAVLQALEVAYAEFFAAFGRRDFPGMLAFLSDDFSWTLLDSQTLDRQGSEAMLREQLAGLEAAGRRPARVGRGRRCLIRRGSARVAGSVR